MGASWSHLCCKRTQRKGASPFTASRSCCLEGQMCNVASYAVQRGEAPYGCRCLQHLKRTTGPARLLRSTSREDGRAGGIMYKDSGLRVGPGCKLHFVLRRRPNLESTQIHVGHGRSCLGNLQTKSLNRLHPPKAVVPRRFHLRTPIQQEPKKTFKNSCTKTGACRGKRML